MSGSAILKKKVSHFKRIVFENKLCEIDNSINTKYKIFIFLILNIIDKNKINDIFFTKNIIIAKVYTYWKYTGRVSFIFN